jgi:UDP-glucose 4-epimerase
VEGYIMILIIGGMGFIGLNTAQRLLEVGEKVVITQHTSHRIPTFLKDKIGTRLSIERMDVTNPYEVFDAVRRNQIESIINLMAPPARSVSTQADYHLYTVGLQNVLQAAQTFGLKRVSLGSSVSVYSGLPEGPYREDMPLPVDSPTQVAAFKKGMEMHALYYASRVRLDVVSLRIASIYGPLYYSMHNPISRMCHAAVNNIEPDFSDQPGDVYEDDRRDWTYVKDVARGIQMVHTAKTLAHRIYNIGSGNATSHKEIFEAIQQVVPGARCTALRPGWASSAPANPAQELTRIQADVGYEPEFTIVTGIAAYIDWLRHNPY